jgi:hypothetical protein
MNGPVSHSNSHSAPRVLEQHNLLGGTDLLPVTGSSKRRRTKTFHVPTERRMGFAMALALVVAGGKKQARELGTTSLSRCPRCGHMGPTLRDFGTRVIRGERRPQSWCRGCRGQHLPALSAPSAPAAKSATAPKATMSAAVSEGWLFPPETLDTRPPRPGKRSIS